MSEKMFDPGAPEIFVSGLGEVEEAGGGCYRFVFYTRTKDGRETAVKLVAPGEAVPPALLLAAKATRACICEATKRRLSLN